ncbi:hypothetical protein B0H17DRAFT_1049252 [Mycena rosella]|uniref:Uncharacterized protein n=1 Tax=Mycena rosella TaxID=1033263 RepID=A0AAD7DUF4_MYCRO|nr:hypothetical protein B0H17DRAFT_1049252 [Mycena rosella]
MGDAGPGAHMRNHSQSGLGVEEGGADRQSTVSEDIGLAYMSMGDPPHAEEGEHERAARLSKHVRFGGDSVFAEPEPPYMKREDSTASGGRTRRVPPPAMDPVEDERALNAAAAREVSRELDALNFSPPAPQPPQVQVQGEGAWEFAQVSPKTSPRTSPKMSSPSRENREYGSPPKGRDYSPSPQSQYVPPPAPNREPPNRDYAASPPLAQYASPPNREPSPLIPPVAPFSRKATLDNNALPPGAGHERTPSWDPPAQPAPLAPGHHTTPSWALAPASPAESPLSPASPRLDAPYRAPAASRSSSSLNAQAPPGARTISAAAFRRPQKTASGDVADTSPLAFKKRLPASPYPQQRVGSGLRDSPAPQQPPPQQEQQRQSAAPEDDFDYISAYTNGGRDSQAYHDDGSPMQADFDYGRLGQVGVVGGAPTSPGYSQGRFATDLDPDSIR